MDSIRVRFAPSPTGDLHIGGVRTALFNWLFARKSTGSFILRIEDTDEARSTDASVGVILDALTWLGLGWDEGPGKEPEQYAPYYQMARKEKGIYQKYADELIARGLAYPCYCTAAEVEEMRAAATAAKRMPRYDGRCGRLSPEDRADRAAKGLPCVIRFRMPEAGGMGLDDIVRGRVDFENAHLDDFILIKPDGVPTYNFACVIDDHLMEITHVVRGDDHLSNTPKQLHLYKALGWTPPRFAHLSMILGSDGARLSKRHGHTSVLEYRSAGYLPEALINYLALLGWSTTDSQQLFEQADMIEKFSLDRCSSSPAVFDPEKLLWMNGEYIRKKTPAELIALFDAWVGFSGSSERIRNWDRGLLERVITLEHDKAKLLSDIPGLVDFFFADEVEYLPAAVEKVLKPDTARPVIEESIKRLENMDDFSATALEAFARALAVEKGLKNGQVFHPLRVALSGRTTGPSLFHMMEIFGRPETIRRLNRCVERIYG